ncbi:cytochrome P450 [Diaporthe sp. PMI_573]|nr:cytochrome P450 [Diaporthaceae sp. PMI_573]
MLSITIFMLLGLIGLQLLLVLHRLFFSPIANIPGSKLTAATGWYETYYDVFKGGQFIFKLEEWHQRYGPIIRINPWEVHIADPEFYDVLYSSKSRHSKPEAWRYRFGLPLSTFDVIHHDQHRYRRQAIAPPFSRKRVLEYEPSIQKYVNRMCDRILGDYRGTQRPVCLDEAYAALTSDVINDHSFGISYDFLEYPDFRTPFTTSIRKLAMSLHVSGHFPWFLSLMQSLPESVLAIINPDMKPVFEFHGVVRTHIKRIMSDYADNGGQKKTWQPTVFSDLLESDLRPEDKSLDLLHQEAASITGAGIETTKTALAVASFHILDNPHVLERLQRELLEAIPDPAAAPSLAYLETLPYLDAVVQESLRLSFGISQRLVRINPHSVTHYGRFVIPPGVPLSMTSYLQHRDPKLFPEPDVFRPERWLHENSGGARKHPLAKYVVPFGKGPRQCLGMNLAMAELYLVLAHVFRRVDMELF